MKRGRALLLSLCALVIPTTVQSVSITQSLDPTTILASGSASCNSLDVHVDNSYIRRFFLEVDHGISGPYAVTSVDFGIESATAGTGVSQPVTVNLYTIPVGATLLFANLSSIGSVDLDIADGVTQSIHADVTGTVLDAAADDLVVEVFTPDGTAAGHMLRIGSNNAGQTRPSYIAAAAAGCDLPEPTDIGTLGDPPFTDMHIVMVVNADEAVGYCCDGPACSIETEADCLAIPGGSYGGDGTDCTGWPCGGGPTVYESMSPDSLGVGVGTATGSPYDHLPAASDELYYHLDDGTGLPALIQLVKGGLGLLIHY